MTARTVRFTGPRRVVVEEGSVPDPDANEVRVTASRSAISPGTELLVYRDEVPGDLPLDPSIDALGGRFEYPLSYGYAVVGRVTAVGADIADEWIDRRVFAFHPHASHFCVRPSELVRLPSGRDSPDATSASMLPMVETAAGLVMDGRPRIGERVVVFGQGLHGLVTTALLSSFPLETLVTVDPIADRRERSAAVGADASVAPDDPLPFDGDGRADLAYELSGNPAAVDPAIAATGDDGRLLIGSWYGDKSATVALGGRFHRSRIRIRASQVSAIDADHAGRWDKERRLDLAVDLLPRLDPGRFVTHRFPVEDAPRAYELLDGSPEEALAVVFTY